MILIVTNKGDYTADFLILRMKERDVPFLRFNTEEFPRFVELSLKIENLGYTGYFKLGGENIDLGEIQSVWYRRPRLSEPSPQIEDTAARNFIVSESRETLQGLWRMLPCFWVSHPDKIRVAESKLNQLVVAARIGFTIPATLVTNSPQEAEEYYSSSSSKLVYKPQQYGRLERGENVSLLYTSVVQANHTNQFDAVQLSPVLFQQYVPKKLELRVTVVGERVFAVEVHSQEIEEAKDDWRRVDPLKLRHVPCELPRNVMVNCIQLVKVLGLAFGAIDLIVTPDGEFVFLEINPNGQWAWIEQMCPELRIRDALIDLLCSGM